MKLELKHLAPYLPYELKVINGIDIHPIINLGKNHVYLSFGWVQYAFIKPILRPMRDIADNILIKGGWVCPMEVIDLHEPNEFTDFAYFNDEQWHNFNWSYQEAVKLFEWKFDLFNLIDAGLAIDMNTLK